MDSKSVELINNFCNILESIAGEMSEHRIFWCLAETDKELHELHTKTNDNYRLNLLGKMIREINQLTSGVEQVGFGQYMEDYPKVITAYRHMIDERDAKPEINRLNLRNRPVGEYEDYEPNPYDGTYSEE